MAPPGDPGADPVGGLQRVQAAPAGFLSPVGSPFLTDLNADGGTRPQVQHTVIATRADEVVTPYTNAFLPAAANVTSLTVQDQCLLDGSDHLELAYDPIALTDVLKALDPAHQQAVPCQVVLPVTGPVG